MKEIHQLETIELGKNKQFISIHGNSIENPILLMLHGGPGTAQIGFIRHFTAPLENDFIVVNWDQRGSGKSYKFKPDASTMCLNQFIEDTKEIIAYLLKRFGQKQLFLLGHSWGTVLGLEVAKQIPHTIKAYIAVSQVVNMAKGEEISYQFTLNKAKEQQDKKAIADLERIGQPPYKNFKDNLKKGEWLTHFGGSTHSIDLKKTMQKASSLKEYNIWDWLYRFPKGVYFSTELLLSELMNIDFQQKINSVDIPIYSLEGTSDYQVPFILTESYFEKIQAPEKSITWFEECGHMIPFEQTEKFISTLLEIKQSLI